LLLILSMLGIIAAMTAKPSEKHEENPWSRP